MEHKFGNIYFNTQSRNKNKYSYGLDGPGFNSQ